MKQIILALLKGYKLLISPVLPPACNYHPSCSQYAVDAVSKHGAVKGLWLGGKRLIRCNPLQRGGYDPVP